MLHYLLRGMLPGLFFLCASNVFSAQQIQVGTLKIASGESKTLTGTTVKRVAVAGGEAAPAKMTFSGEGLVEVPDAGLNLPGSFTVEFDVAFEATGGNPYLLSKRAKDTSDVTSGYWIELVNGRSLEFVAAGAERREASDGECASCVHLKTSYGRSAALLSVVCCCAIASRSWSVVG